jgi:hypothetical protein
MGDSGAPVRVVGTGEQDVPPQACRAQVSDDRTGKTHTCSRPQHADGQHQLLDDSWAVIGVWSSPK